MNSRDAFALSNNPPSRTAFQPIDVDPYAEPKRRTPTTITFKSSKAILSAETNRIEERLLDEPAGHDSFGADPDEEELYRSISLANECKEASSSSEPLPPFQDGTSRSSSNCSGQSLFSDEASCLVFSPGNRATSQQQAADGRVDSKQSSIDSSSLYSTHRLNNNNLNKHLLISDKHSPQLLFGSQLPAGVCCVLSSKPSGSSLNELITINEAPANRPQDNLELLDIPKRTKRKHKFRSQSSLYQQLDQSGNRNSLANLNSMANLNSLTSQQLASLMAGSPEANATHEAKPQFRFTRYDTVEEDGNHVKLLAIDHLPAQVLFPDGAGMANPRDIANLNQARLIQTNLLKQKFSKNKTSQQPDTNNSHQQQQQIAGQLSSLANNSFAIIAKNNFGVLGGGQSKCSCNEPSREINNNRPAVCLECENTKKILQSNFVQLVPMRPSGSTSNSNTSPLSIQISPLSAASSGHSTCSAQPNSTVSSASLQSSLPIGIALTGQPMPVAATNNAAGNVFNYDAATIHQYAISLADPLNQQANLIKLGQQLQQQQQQQQDNAANTFSALRLQERPVSSLSGISSDPLSMAGPPQISAGHLPTVRSASSCAQYSVIPNSMQNYQAAANLPNQFQPIAPANHSRSEQNLVSSNRFYNGVNNSFVPNQPAGQFYSQQQIYSGSPTGQLVGQTNAATGPPNHFNRPLRLSFRTPSPTLLTTSSLAGDSNLESPSQTYVDNNDSVNIFNKYQTGSSSNYYYGKLLLAQTVNGSRNLPIKGGIHLDSFLTRPLSLSFTGPKEHDFFRKGNFRFSRFSSILIGLNGPK